MRSGSCRYARLNDVKLGYGGEDFAEGREIPMRADDNDSGALFRAAHGFFFCRVVVVVVGRGVRASSSQCGGGGIKQELPTPRYRHLPSPVSYTFPGDSG